MGAGLGVGEGDGGAGGAGGVGGGLGVGAGLGHQVPPQFWTHFSGPAFVQNILLLKQLAVAQFASWQHQPEPGGVGAGGVGGGVGDGSGHQWPLQFLRHVSGPFIVQNV